MADLWRPSCVCAAAGPLPGLQRWQPIPIPIPALSRPHFSVGEADRKGGGLVDVTTTAVGGSPPRGAGTPGLFDCTTWFAQHAGRQNPHLSSPARILMIMPQPHHPPPKRSPQRDPEKLETGRGDGDKTPDAQDSCPFCVQWHGFAICCCGGLRPRHCEGSLQCLGAERTCTTTTTNTIERRSRGARSVVGRGGGEGET